MAKQDPWADVPVVTDPATRPAATVNGQRYATVRSAYTTETPEELAAQGYTLDPQTGTYARTVGRVEVTPTQDMPWESVAPAVTDRSGFGQFGAWAQSAAEQIPGVDEAAAGLLSLTNGIPYSEARQLQAGLAQEDREIRPLARNIGGVTGFAAGLAAPGAGFVRNAQGAARLARGGAIGAGYGAAYGAGAGEDTYASRMQGLALGAGTGFVGGAAVEAASPFVTRLAGIASDALPRLPGSTGRQARAAVRNGANAEAGAAIRLADSIGPNQFARRQQARDLGVDLSVLDTLDNTGERLIRTAAGPAGPAADLAVENMVARQANLKPEVMAVTRGLSPYQRSAEVLRESIDQTRSRLADEQYAPAYETVVPFTEDVLAALSDAPGRAALNRARQAAVARQNAQQVEEIDRLIAGDTSPVSAGTLDRVRIAMSGRGHAMQQRPDTRDIGGGLMARANQIDTALEGVPELAPARATYRDLSGAMEAIDEASSVFSTDPADFAARVRDMTPTQREAMVVGVRQSIMDMLGRQREAGTGALQVVAESPYARQNLETLLGQEEAGRYIGSLRERIGQTQRAARVSPSTNSQTFGRLQDEETFNVANAIGAVADSAQALRGSPAGLARTIERLGARAALRPDEREAIVRLGLGSADELERIVALAEQARRAGRRPPRAVMDFVGRSRNVLGADSPVTQQLQTILLPTRVSAEEEQQ